MKKKILKREAIDFEQPDKIMNFIKLSRPSGSQKMIYRPGLYAILKNNQ